MSLLNKPKSVLDHGGDSENAILHTITERVKHNVDQDTVLYAGTPSEDDKIHARHMDYNANRQPGTIKTGGEDFPLHLHSTINAGDYFEVKNEDEYDVAMATGFWSETPIEFVAANPDGQLITEENSTESTKNDLTDEGGAKPFEPTPEKESVA